MKPKHVIILGGLFVVLIGVYFISNKDKSESQKKDGLVAGDKVLSITNINEITGVKITGSENSVQLGRKDGKWVVVNRADYKADFIKISRALKKLEGLKVAEQRRVGKKHYGRFDLEEPESEDGAGVKIQLSKNEQDPVGEIIIGKRYGGATIDSGQQGGGDGKYVRVSSNDNQVFIVSDSLFDIESSPSGWLEKNPFGIDKSKDIIVEHSDGTKFEFIREKEGDDASLKGLAKNEELNTSNASTITSPFVSFNFKDVSTGEDADPEKTGLKTPLQVTVTTFDGFKYDLKLGKGEGENVDSAEKEATVSAARYHLTYRVSAEFTDFVLEGREPQEDEKLSDDASDEDRKKVDKLKKERDAADKQKQEEEFKDEQEKLKEKLEKEKAFAGVVYEIDSWSAEKFFNKREDLVKEKEPEVEEKPEAAAGNGSPPEGVSIPGIPGALIPGVEAVEPKSKETSESNESVEKQGDSE
jgi:hypothetical protein